MFANAIGVTIGASVGLMFAASALKAEAAYYTSPDREQDEYVIYVLQFERRTR